MYNLRPLGESRAAFDHLIGDNTSQFTRISSKAYDKASKNQGKRRVKRDPIGCYSGA